MPCSLYVITYGSIGDPVFIGKLEKYSSIWYPDQAVANHFGVVKYKPTPFNFSRLLKVAEQLEKVQQHSCTAQWYQGRVKKVYTLTKLLTTNNLN